MSKRMLEQAREVVNAVEHSGDLRVILTRVKNAALVIDGQLSEAIDALREIHDFGEPTKHYKDALRGQQAFLAASEILNRCESTCNATPANDINAPVCQPITTAFDRLAEAAGDTWDDVDPEAYVQDLRAEARADYQRNDIVTIREQEFTRIMSAVEWVERQAQLKDVK